MSNVKSQMSNQCQMTNAKTPRFSQLIKRKEPRVTIVVMSKCLKHMPKALDKRPEACISFLLASFF